jgi:D-3-phosphoglycerate dehydrogenase / 2-oxoglutarate reductase
MIKPLIVYYNVQDFQKSSLTMLQKFFDPIVLANPDEEATEQNRDDVTAIFAPMGYWCGKEKMEKYPNLCVIGTPTTGLPHIDAAYAQSRNITICSLFDQQRFLKTITPTAELSWGMMISLVKHIPEAFDSVCDGDWNGKAIGGKCEKMLSEMSLGVIGLGRLGSLVAGYGKAFRMTVRYYDPFVPNHDFIRCSNIFELAQQSDVVSIHVHGTVENEKLIDRKIFKELVPGSYLVNTSRGNVVDESDLLDALQSGHLGGAALDTLEGEHLPDFVNTLAQHPLVRYANTHNNLLLTPHYGGCTIDAWELTEQHIIEMMVSELHERNLL